MSLVNLTYKEEVVIVTVKCCNCGTIFGMDNDFNKRLRSSGKGFYCPNGHEQHYNPNSFNKEEYENKLREANNKIANISSEKVQLENQLTKTKNDLKRLKNGVCPCCNKSFKGLNEHIKKQHLEFFNKT